MNKIVETRDVEEDMGETSDAMVYVARVV